MAEGISKGMFAVGLMIAIISSATLSTFASMQLAVGSKGDKGDKGDQGSQGFQGPRGEQGLQGPQGPPINFGIGNLSGWLPAPAYDSGWFNISQDQVLALAHNLGTTNVLVYVIGKGIYGSINQIFYGGELVDMKGLFWHSIDNTFITIYRLGSDVDWAQVRVMIWKIAEP